MHYYGTRLSENISKREPEGYLLCLNVPVARTGTQDYLPSELDLPPGPGMISVYRPEEEVFSPETIASFEGMPVTNDHPPDGVDVSNIRALQKGHAHNVRRGSGEESDLLLADLIITDPFLIDAVLDGKREISCGYTYELCEENGSFIQRKIRGNHVAVVDAGRAGPRVSIKDRKPVPETGTTHLKGVTDMKKSLSKVLARMAKDGDIETVAEFIEEMVGPAEAEQPEELPAETQEVEAPVVENAENVIALDEEGLAGILERLDCIIGLLTPAAVDQNPAAEQVAEAVGEVLAAAAEQAVDPMAEEISAVMEEVLDPAASAGNAEERGEGPEVLAAGDALRAAMTAVRPVLAAIPEARRRKMAGDIAGRIRNSRGRTQGGGAYRGIASFGGDRLASCAELGRRIMASRNANARKERG